MGTSGGGKDRIGVLPESGNMTNGTSDEHDVTLFEAGEVGPSIPSVNKHNSGEVLLSAHSMKSKIK
jgi:hypothetical protein